ncbi:SAM-dependent methyltransferase [Pendulispora albinea]|uniref:S-adenosyl-L-methionine-dependent methyltransferase n=1 Tax=Pendulispora albinea TaxID=2741071 RepID=A0ABZ2M659_9BACT
MNPVAITGLIVAAIRAEESKRSDRLFEDPFATVLAGEDGRRALAKYREAAGLSVPIIEVRTRYFDEGLTRVVNAGIRQVVILAAGMDARAHRLVWPSGTRVFELDQPEVLAHKAEVLASVKPSCDRVVIPVNLEHDWTEPLRASSFDPARPTAWLVEGLLQYLEEPSVRTLFARIEALSGSGSVVFYDAVGRALLHAPQVASTLAVMKELGAPWVFATDDPGSLLSKGWAVTLDDPAELGRQWTRWPLPAVPGMPPLGHLIEARKA